MNDKPKSPFGFRVEFEEGDDYLPLSPERVGDQAKFKVSLDHQCDRWRIDNDSWYLDGSFKDEAVEELERFIKEAQAALDALRQGREFQND